MIGLQRQSDYISDFVAEIHVYFKSKWFSDFLIPISLKPNVKDISYFNLWILMDKII